MQVLFRTICVVATLSLFSVAPALAQSNNPGGAVYGDPAAPTTTPPAGAPAPGDPTQTGGEPVGQPGLGLTPTVPGAVAKLLPNGLAAAPTDAPVAVQRAIWAANAIIGRPYIYGGGHGAFKASGYDCSGTVSYALHGASLLRTPMDSGEFMRWGDRGNGQWISVYANYGHAYAVIAGLRLDTSAAGDPSGGKGPRWRPTLRSNRGFRVRHLPGL
ncbi:MAG: hypothetical protein NVS1B9_06840 [Solirubrobacteraceae bacterium]